MSVLPHSDEVLVVTSLFLFVKLVIHICNANTTCYYLLSCIT